MLASVVTGTYMYISALSRILFQPEISREKWRLALRYLSKEAFGLLWMGEYLYGTYSRGVLVMLRMMC